MDWFINPDHAPIIIAEQYGYFKENGLKVEIIEPADPNDPPKQVAAGKIDIAISYQILSKRPPSLREDHKFYGVYE